MNYRILAVGIVSAATMGWLSWLGADGSWVPLGRASAVALLVILAAQGRNWARLVVVAWFGIVGASLFVAGLGTFALVSLGVGLLFLVAATIIFREKAVIDTGSDVAAAIEDD